VSDLRSTAATRQRTLNFRLRLILKYGLLRGPAPRMASLTSKPPSKPVQALKECLVRKRSVYYMQWFGKSQGVCLEKEFIKEIKCGNFLPQKDIVKSKFV